MFIRVKRIKDKSYAYLVRNRWTKRGSRQKVGRYLGRVYVPAKIAENGYYGHVGDDPGSVSRRINRMSAREIAESLLGWVLSSHGFLQQGAAWKLDDYTVDLRSLRVMKGDKAVALNINNDFLCTHTLRSLMRFKSDGDGEVVGLALAKAFISAGIPVPGEVFVHVFNKVYKDGQSFMG